MKEKQQVNIVEVGPEEFERYDLNNYLGNHYNFIGIGVMRNDMSPRAKKLVRRHIEHHLLHDWKNPNQNKTINAVNEVKALLLPGLKNPVGFAEAVIFKRRLTKSNKQQQ